MNKYRNNTVSNSLVQSLITSIYDAGLDTAHWQETLYQITRACNGEQSCLRLVNLQEKKVDQVYNFNKDPHWSQAYVDHYVEIDPWLNILATKNPVYMNCTHHLIPDKEYKRMEFYQDYLVPQDVHYGLGGLINITSNNTGYLSIHRSQNNNGFSKNYLKLIYALAPHIKKSVLINDKLQDSEFKHHLLIDALEQVIGPLLLVNRNSEILFINAVAEDLVKNTSGLSIIKGCISIQHRAENIKLQELIFQATLKTCNGTFKQGGAMRYASVNALTSMSILVSPINAANINQNTYPDDIAIILLNTNNSQSTMTATMLKGLYNLTSGEARLTLALCQGLTLDEIAAKLCRSKNTLRAQLRAIFKKTGVGRQAELIRLIGANQ